MRGYDSTSYGDGFFDVYDDWYADVTDVEATVRLITRLAAPQASDGHGERPRVLELGVGTGRLAFPLAAAGLDVVGVDTSDAMLGVLEQERAGRAVAGAHEMTGSVTAVRADMVDELPTGPFDVALVAYNTIFNLLDADRQQACFTEVADRLRPGGAFVVEAIVPDPDAPAGSDVTVRSLAADRVVLTVSDHRPSEQRTDGQFVEFTEAGGVRLRPWAIRWCSVTELDAMADAAGLTLVDRFADMSGTTFDQHADAHVSVYRRPA